ncbi:hypothetical protein [Salicola sp. Rm-C-2C1-2]|uniref:hypothetical protein n=1 Tax=Salicola sp. Rm-C-2C1-2 TaxID=3141321 RepID=UPI0032E41805
MGMTLTIITVGAAAMSIAGINIRDFFRNSPKAQDKATIQSYIKFLEGKEVLLAPIDDEVQPAVIKSLEKIKDETERVRAGVNDEAIQTVLLQVILTLSKELQSLYRIDADTDQGKYKMYRSLQKIRLDMSKALAMFCAAFGIDPTGNNSRLGEFILNFSIRPRN